MERSALRWLVELARTTPGLVRSYLPGGPVGARARERIMVAVAEVDGSRWCAWVHGSWASYLGDGTADAAELDEAVLAYARRCALAGRPLDPGPLRDLLPTAGVEAVRASVAQVEVSAAAGRAVESLVGRVLSGRRADVGAAVVDAATAVVAVPVTVPVAATAAALRLVRRLAPPVPDVDAPDGDDANLLVHLLGRAVPAYLANAGVRLLVLRLPVPISIGLRSGRSSATVRVGRGRVEIVNGIADDAVVVLDGDVDPLVQLAAGSMVRDLRPADAADEA